MGAAVTVELNKPIDGSDIKLFDHAKSELIQLRNLLGSLTKDKNKNISNHMTHGKIDLSDICLGLNENDDFNRCVEEICHIRKALQLSTQKARRKTRYYLCKEESMTEILTDSQMHERELYISTDDPVSNKTYLTRKDSESCAPEEDSDSDSDSD